ncbi:rhodanese-like domain-containing protein [Halocynthiibacter styelae]|uniref:Rhodanese-like domain-containing protein n=1 Tax=Halocynthiibacter styelae TaxID=2761955 RepID=A0A8J7IL30_9RHOB|nr:rhodanese-like domain-containing protein [Paenihalocynthiibacter styelae]MBI1495278.1 rhodanese-like domain-containing protein [Paenihalocynthiibacter styelae]
MNPRVVSDILNISPQDAWELLKNETSCKFIDVRTRAEWGFVGVPDLRDLNQETIFVEWASFPSMSANPHFGEQVLEALNGEIPDKLLFLCRSGVRSLHAARAVADLLSGCGKPVQCINVAEGFEGDLNAEGQRGQLNGWKLRGLAWRQS